MENSNVQQNIKKINYKVNCYMFAKQKEIGKGLIDENHGDIERAILDSFMNVKVEDNQNFIDISANGQVKTAKRTVNGKEIEVHDIDAYKNAYKEQKEKGKTLAIKEEISRED